MLTFLIAIIGCYNNKSVKKSILFFVLSSALIISTIVPSISYAQPYGKGKYNTGVPYGSQTSLSINTNGNISVEIHPTSSGSLSTALSTVTVTSLDVVGYKLYIRALTNTYMDNLGSHIPASLNGSPAALALNTWGYNTDASANFVGISNSDVLIHSITTPASSGDVTNVTYGITPDLLIPIGKYVASVIYTAVPQTD